jgi:hypothetical protein
MRNGGYVFVGHSVFSYLKDYFSPAFLKGALYTGIFIPLGFQPGFVEHPVRLVFAHYL